MQKTKIVCTLGPATNDVEIMKQLIQNGMVPRESIFPRDIRNPCGNDCEAETGERGAERPHPPDSGYKGARNPRENLQGG